ncbi:hypothetical protein RUND412_000305 [Rhizina undulata]
MFTNQEFSDHTNISSTSISTPSSSGGPPPVSTFTPLPHTNPRQKPAWSSRDTDSFHLTPRRVATSYMSRIIIRDPRPILSHPAFDLPDLAEVKTVEEALELQKRTFEAQERLQTRFESLEQSLHEFVRDVGEREERYKLLDSKDTEHWKVSNYPPLRMLEDRPDKCSELYGFQSMRVVSSPGRDHVGVAVIEKEPQPISAGAARAAARAALRARAAARAATKERNGSVGGREMVSKGPGKEKETREGKAGSNAGIKKRGIRLES